MSNMRINFYITREVVVPTLLSLMIFTFLLLMGRIPRLTEMVINKGVPLQDIMQLFASLLPSFFSITVPLSFLLGILLAFGRLSADSEFVALKASGISLYTLIRPVLLLAALFTLLSLYLNMVAIPQSTTAFRSKIFDIASNQANVGIQAGIFNDEFDGIVLYAANMDDKKGLMSGVFISDEREGNVPATILAEQGQFISDPENFTLTLRLKQGNIHRQPVAARGKEPTYQTIAFSSYDINLDIGKQLQEGQDRDKSKNELSTAELKEAIVQAETAIQRYRLEGEYFLRIVTSFAPLVLALVGVPLGLQSNRSGKGSGFALALAIALAYFVILSLSRTIAAKGYLPTSITLWTSNVIFLLGGSFFLHRTAIERPPEIFERIFSLPKTIAAWWEKKGRS
ncbi:MAG TPA: LPS export ABC transporter permease LptF [Geopsychrobacteraceae bacterium]|nr:LPS export ABC transporter permease LptF [Geopsychrobacteraceae bacterium]